MCQLILVTGLTVLLFGTCSPSFDQEARLAKSREALLTRQGDQTDVTTAKQAAVEQALAALVAKRADEKKRFVLRMEKMLSELEACLKAYENEINRPEEETLYVRMLQKRDELRSKIERTRAEWKRMTEELTPSKRG